MGKFTELFKKSSNGQVAKNTEAQEAVSETIHGNDARNLTHIAYEVVPTKAVDSTIDPRIITFYDEQSPVTEQYRILRTNLIALSPHKPLRSFTITSSTHGEGKTITAINLAISMAHGLDKKSILLVDADMRHCAVSKYLGLSARPGLAELLTQTTNLDDALVHIGIDNLTVLTAGQVPHNPAELLGSVQMGQLVGALKARYDIVIFDAPPLMPVADTGLIGVHTDGAIMVVQANRTQKGVVKHSEMLLQQLKTKLLGYVLTNVQYHIPSFIYKYLEGLSR